ADGGQDQSRFVGHTGAIPTLFVARHTSEKTVFSASTDRSVRSWSLARATVTGTRFAGHESWVSAIVFTPDGKKVVSGSWDGTVRVWDVEKPKEMTVLESHESKIYCVAVSRDGK